MHEPASSLPREHTDDPDRYLIPAARVSAEFRARILDADREVAPARPAATVAVVRGGERGLEVLLLRRPRRSGFAADAWVFPGGAVDAADREVRPLDPAAPEWWAQRLGVADAGEAWGIVVAAIREAWEETALLVGQGRRGVEPRRDGAPEETGFAGLMAAGGLGADPDELVYVAHWITPLAERRRFDTHFFVAIAPADAPVRPAAGEIVEARWMTPAEAVRGAREGALVMLPPTIHTLRLLGGYETPERMMLELRDRAVRSYLPRMEASPEGIVVRVEEYAPPRGAPSAEQNPVDPDS
jgi:8-oxo-dGTP pyrophosphatase MutT (NUDIX family)